MGKNNKLTAAKKAKNDEFYTELRDIEDEVWEYRSYFKDKVVFLNCDDPSYSNFWQYFAVLNFDELELKKVISTHFNSDGGSSYKLERHRGNPKPIKTALNGDGDFQSAECIELLKEADIVCTNPPFSLFKEYIAQLFQYEKKFLIIGNKNAISYKEVFPLLMDNKMWLGYHSPKSFRQPNTSTPKKMAGLTRWFTNLDTPKRHKKMPFDMAFSYELNPKLYPRYDNYDAIEVDKVVKMPYDYYGVMGVPITYLDHYCPEQFEIIGITKTWFANDSLKTKIYPKQTQVSKSGKQSLVTKLNDGAAIVLPTPPQDDVYYIVGKSYYKQIYARILIRRIDKAKEETD